MIDDDFIPEKIKYLLAVFPALYSTRKRNVRLRFTTNKIEQSELV